MNDLARVQGQRWSDFELNAAVEAYVFLLGAHRAGLSYPGSKAMLLLLRGPLSGRNDASLRYRMRNISAVVAELGGPILPEYSPAAQVGSNVRARLRTMLRKHRHFQQILAESRRDSSRLPLPSRENALAQLDDLRSQLQELEREVGVIGIGHNRPPEPISTSELSHAQFDVAREAIHSLEREIRSSASDRDKVISASNSLAEFGLKMALWAGERATKFVDVSLAILAPVVFAKVTGLAPLIVDALQAVAKILLN